MSDPRTTNYTLSGGTPGPTLIFPPPKDYNRTAHELAMRLTVENAALQRTIRKWRWLTLVGVAWGAFMAMLPWLLPWVWAWVMR